MTNEWKDFPADPPNASLIEALVHEYKERELKLPCRLVGTVQLDGVFIPLTEFTDNELRFMLAHEIWVATNFRMRNGHN